ncbi:MAG TPA: hypothetical protein VF790_07910 [Dissulfurispiraceae bacterium]
MCMAYEQKCSCGRSSAGFHFKDNIMSEQVIRNVYCPLCSSGVVLKPECMVVDNGWIIEYDMDMASFMGQKISHAVITPAFLFNGEYCTWRGIYPGDHDDSIRERNALAGLARTDPARYLREIKGWALKREERLKAEGWRKAMAETAR